MAVFYPKSVESIYERVCVWQYAHFQYCPHMPDDYKEYYKYLKEQSPTHKKRGRKSYWAKSALSMGLRDISDDENGITYQPSNALGPINSNCSIDSPPGSSTIVNLGIEMASVERTNTTQGNKNSQGKYEDKVNPFYKNQDMDAGLAAIVASKMSGQKRRCPTRNKINPMIVEDPQVNLGNQDVDAAILNPEMSGRKRGRPTKNQAYSTFNKNSQDNQVNQNVQTSVLDPQKSGCKKVRAAKNQTNPMVRNDLQDSGNQYGYAVVLDSQNSLNTRGCLTKNQANYTVKKDHPNSSGNQDANAVVLGTKISSTTRGRPAKNQADMDLHGNPNKQDADATVLNSIKSGFSRGHPAKTQPSTVLRNSVESVQCEKCAAWHKLPSNINGEKLPNLWYCAMNTWALIPVSCKVTAKVKMAGKISHQGAAGLKLVSKSKSSYDEDSPDLQLESPRGTSILSSASPKRIFDACSTHNQEQQTPPLSQEQGQDQQQQENIRQIVLHQLKQRVEKVECNDLYTKLHRPLPNTTIISFSVAPNIIAMAMDQGREMKELHCSRVGIGCSWKMPLLPQEGFQLPQWERESKRNIVENSKVTKIESIYHHTTWVIPRWIPDEYGKYSEESPSVLFTPQQFVQSVTVKAEKVINKMDHKHRIWKATLSSNHSISPYSYAVEVRGTLKALEVLRELTQAFVRVEIERSNLKRLVNDDNSLVVDIPWVVDLQAGPAEQSLGTRISGVHDANAIGAYIKAIHPNSILAKTLGQDVCIRGCVLLAVNDKEITDASQVGTIVTEAKSQATKGCSTLKIKLTFCLSKFADLSEAPNLLKMKARKRDGSPYNQEENDSLRLSHLIGVRQGQDLKLIQGQAALMHQQEMYQEKVDAEVFEDLDSCNSAESDSCQSASEVQPIALSISKKRDRQNTNQEKKEVKRRKKGDIKELLYSDNSNTDTENVNAIDEAVPKIEKRVPNDGLKNFWVFEAKLKPLFGTDFKDTKINNKFICSSIWKKHKKLLGENTVCGANCKCIMWLPDMTECVIKEYVARQKKKTRVVETEEELKKRTSGICKFFAPRFVPRLEKEYPDENESQLINRLVCMWELHQKNRMYGMKCHENCGCEEEWDQIFGKGDMEKAKVFAKRSTLLNKRMASQANQKQVSKGPVIPRKKKASDPFLTCKKQYAPSEIMNKNRTVSRSLISSLTSRSELYEVAFDSSIALGGFFRTDKNTNRCIVYSIHKDGQMSKDQRLVNGTAVVSIITGETRTSIHSHNHLKHFYENAKRTRSRLSVLFDNQNAKFDSVGNGNEWDNSGHWISTRYLLDEDDGWPGGAKIAQKSQVIKASIGFLTDTMVTSVESNASQMTNHNLTVPEWTSIINTAQPGHSKRAPQKPLIGKKSSFLPDECHETLGSAQNSKQGICKLLSSGIQASRRERTHSKKVMFSQLQNKEVYFCKNEAANVRRVLSNVQVEGNKISPQVSPMQTLVNTIRNGSCKEMLEIFEAQPFEDVDLESVLQKEYTFVWNEMQKFHGNSQDAERRSQKNDFYAKYRVLRIYIHCIHLIERAMNLKKWYALEIELKHFDLSHENNPMIGMIQGDISVKMQNGNVLNDLGPLPPQKFAQHISYGNRESPLVFTVHNNASFCFDQRYFIIDLKMGSFLDSAATESKIGCFKLNLNDVEAKCPGDERPIEYIQSLSQNNSGEILRGYVAITAKKRKANKVYIRDKKKDVLKKLHQQLAQIERFNQDPKVPHGAKLTGNIFGIDGKSILHAAVQLVDDEVLVEKLLTLGADPRSSGHLGIGSPLRLAQKHYNQDAEKEKHLRFEKDVDIELHEKRSNQLRMLVEMLQNHVIEPHAAFAVPSSAIATPTPEQSLPALEKFQSLTSTPKQSSSSSESHQLQSRTIFPSFVPSTETSTIHSAAKENNNHSQKLTRSEEAYCTRKPSDNPTLKSASHHSILGTLNVGHAVAVLSSENPRDKNNYYRRDEEKCHSVGMNRSSSVAEDSIDFTKLTLSNPNWFIFHHDIRRHLADKNVMFRRCLDGKKCRFFKTRTCNFWHDVQAPLPHGQKFPPFDSLPELPSTLVKFTRMNIHWYTAVYIDEDSKLIIYVQKVLPDSGYVSDDGTCWFPSRKEALDSLRYNVYFHKNNDSPSSLPPPVVSRGRSNSFDAEGDHDHNPSYQSHRSHQHRHHQQHHHPRSSRDHNQHNSYDRYHPSHDRHGYIDPYGNNNHNNYYAR